jgi:Ca-activated chloride channel homolog
MITFDHPEIVLLLALIPPALFISFGWKGVGSRIPFPFLIWENDTFDTPFLFQRFLLFLSELALWVGIASLILALAGPRLVEREKIFLHRGADIVFVLDQSPSMAVQDFGETNRFDAAKRAINNFISMREHDPVGLVAFGDEAALLVPPTLDYHTFQKRLEEFSLMELGKGSALGLGIAVASVHLEKSSAEQKIILVVSDGENNAGEITPRSASLVAASLGIRIHAIGVGSENGGPIEFTDPDSGKLFRGSYQGSVQMDLLQEISEATGGRAFLAGNEGALEQIFRELDTLEAVEQKVSTEIRSRILYREMMLFALGLFLFFGFIRRFIFQEVL